MVITNLEEKQNRKIWVPIRGGNRGGWSLFNWQDVRQMPYKDREMYLGNSVTIGVLDKGGKWRKRDWYMKTDKKYKSGQLQTQQQEAIRKDYQRMNAALGIAQKQDEQQLTEHEMRELMKKIKLKKQGYEEPAAPDAIGLGFDKTKVQIRAKPSAKMDNPHRLQAVDDYEVPDEEKREKTKQKKEKKSKKQKKDKKQKKEKKKKDKDKENRHKSDSFEKEQKKKKSKKEKQRQPSQEKNKKEKKEKSHHKKQKQQKDGRRRDRSRSEEKRHRQRRYSSSSSSSSNSD